MATEEKKASSKVDQILEVGQRLLQTRGYDGFSFRDVADEVGIKSASVHYHFPSKADLALRITNNYRADFAEAINTIDEQQLHPSERLQRFAGIFQDTLNNGERMCLCGMLASEAESLPDPVRQETQQFFAEQQIWLAGVIEQGQADNRINETINPIQFAKMFLAALEGAMVISWNVRDSTELEAVTDQLLQLLEVK